MSNIKSFLESGTYIPADSTLAGSSATANILHVSRTLPSIDGQRSFRFILVDTPEQFKPDYWNRVVAVFTTGQTWQFKSYKWQNAPDLFKNALGIYVGWRGEDVPATVKGWGRGVTSAQIEKWNPQQGISGRWRDREVVEGIWDRVEESMRSKGWVSHVLRVIVPTPRSSGGPEILLSTPEPPHKKLLTPKPNRAKTAGRSKSDGAFCTSVWHLQYHSKRGVGKVQHGLTRIKHRNASTNLSLAAFSKPSLSRRTRSSCPHSPPQENPYPFILTSKNNSTASHSLTR
jgi:parafibromin